MALPRASAAIIRLQQALGRDPRCLAWPSSEGANRAAGQRRHPATPKETRRLPGPTGQHVRAMNGPPRSTPASYTHTHARGSAVTNRRRSGSARSRRGETLRGYAVRPSREKLVGGAAFLHKERQWRGGDAPRGVTYEPPRHERSAPARKGPTGRRHAGLARPRPRFGRTLSEGCQHFDHGQGGDRAKTPRNWCRATSTPQWGR